MFSAYVMSMLVCDTADALESSRREDVNWEDEVFNLAMWRVMKLAAANQTFTPRVPSGSTRTLA